METILVKPRDGRELARFRRFFRESGADVEYAPRERAETLEGKIVRLYAEGGYTDAEMGMFFSIPKECRVDPFEVSPSGDVHWADKRNVDDLDTSLGHVKNGLVKKLSREDQKAFLGL